jgi:hypothetical protein
MSNNETHEFHDLYSHGWTNLNKTITFEKEYEKVMETYDFSYQPETSSKYEGEQFLYLRRRRD